MILCNYHGTFAKDWKKVTDIVNPYSYVVDLSIIKGDGGHTQYTFLEAIYLGKVLILHHSWISGPDSIWIENVFDLPNPNLATDTVVCENSNILLSVEHIPGTYQWSTGAISAEITPSSTGLYWVQMTDQNGCLGTDSIYLLINSAPVADLGKTLRNIICCLP